MGTVPVPALHSASTVLTTAETTSWYNAITFALKPPACRAISNALQAVAASTNVTVVFGGETFDQVQTGDTEMHSTSTNPERITIRTAGRYDVSYRAAVATTGTLATLVFKNGVATDIGGTTNASGGQALVAVTDSLVCAIGDYLTLVVFSTVAGSITVANPSSMYVKWVSN